jgi:hypothetical protein
MKRKSWDELPLDEVRRRLARGWRIAYILFGAAGFFLLLSVCIGMYKMLAITYGWPR